MTIRARTIPEKFLVAFSFAGEQRDLVRTIAESVEAKLGFSNVFFDEWFEYYIAGADADVKLQEIYAEKCTLAVLCVSGRYGDKPYTGAEHAAIRARFMKAVSSQDKREQLSILPIRVGDGDMPGIPMTTIVPDIRGMTLAERTHLIIERLNLILPGFAEGAAKTPQWPEEPPPLSWPMADLSQARVAFEHLLTRTASFRFLAICGPSEVGKTHITKRMLGNALTVLNTHCGRFDFKGTTNVDAEVQAFAQQLEVPLPPSSLELNERLSQMLDALKRKGQPTLMVFDTYEAAGQSRDWVEKQLLPSLIRATWLRVVIVGQKVPEGYGQIWDAVSSPLITLSPPHPEDWYEFVVQYRPKITLEFVRQAYEYCGGKASILVGLIGPAR